MADFANHKEIVLAQQVVGIVDAARLRILNGHQPVIDLAACDDAKDIGKAAAGDWVDLPFGTQGLPLSKIDTRGLVTKCSTFPLKSYPYALLLLLKTLDRPGLSIW